MMRKSTGRILGRSLAKRDQATQCYPREPNAYNRNYSPLPYSAKSQVDVRQKTCPSVAVGELTYGQPTHFMFDS